MSTIQLTPDQDSFAHACVAAGRYATVEDVVADAIEKLRLFEAKRQALLRSVLESSEDARRNGTSSWEEVKARIDARIASRPRQGE